MRGFFFSFTFYNGGSDDPGSATATVTFLHNITGGSATAAAASGFFSPAKTGTLDVTVSDIELQLNKATGWAKIDVSSSSTKACPNNVSTATDATSEPACIEGQFSTKNDAVVNTTEISSYNAMGRVKFTVSAGASPVSIKSISGLFGSGKTVESAYIKVGDGDYEQITGTTTLSKGIKVADFSVGKTIPANGSKDVYILLGKSSAPSAGIVLDVAEVVLSFETAVSE